MEKLPGFVAQEESRLVCRLRCSLYGLKQSPEHRLVGSVIWFRSLV